MTELLQNTKAIIDIAQEAVKPIAVELNADGLLFIPAANPATPGKVFDLDTFGRLPHPRRKTGHVKVFNVQAMNKIVNHNQDAGHTVIYADGNLEKPAIVAVMNDHGDNGPGYRDFRCEVVFRPTVQWAKWLKISGKMMPQADFAEFIEENLNDIVDPPGAEMLEIVTYLTATRAVEFKSAFNLSNGQIQLQNIEAMDAKVKAGQIAVPTEFTVALSPIEGSAIYKMPARFRYRLSEGKLSLGLKLLRTEDVMDLVFGAALNEIVLSDNIILVSGTP